MNIANAKRMATAMPIKATILRIILIGRLLNRSKKNNVAMPIIITIKNNVTPRDLSPDKYDKHKRPRQANATNRINIFSDALSFFFWLFVVCFSVFSIY